MDPLLLGCSLLKLPWAAFAMEALGYYGHGLIGTTIGVLMIVVGHRREHHRLKLAGFAVIAAMAAAGIVTETLKQFFQVPRPRSIGTYSFPSGHSGTAFALATTFSHAFPAWAPLYFLLAVFTALSRLYFRAHFLVDVVVGGALGAGSGLWIARRFLGDRVNPPSSLRRRAAWLAVFTFALCSGLLFYGLEKRLDSRRFAGDARLASSPETLVFDFGTPAVRRLLGPGWSRDISRKATQHTLVWADALQAELAAEFPAATSYRWHLNLMPYINDRGPACQFVEVRVNRTPVAQLLLEQDWNWYKFDVPGGVIRPGKNDVTFIFNYAAGRRSRRPRSNPAAQRTVAFDMLYVTPLR